MIRYVVVWTLILHKNETSYVSLKFNMEILKFLSLIIILTYNKKDYTTLKNWNDFYSNLTIVWK